MTTATSTMSRTRPGGPTSGSLSPTRSASAARTPWWRSAGSTAEANPGLLPVEEQRQLALRGLGRVAPVHEVLRDLDPEVATDRPRRPRGRIGRADQGPKD